MPNTPTSFYAFASSGTGTSSADVSAMQSFAQGLMPVLTQKTPGKTCSFCDNGGYSYTTNKYIVDGVKDYAVLCGDCYGKNKKVLFCPECMKLYHAKGEYGMNYWAYSPCHSVPCKKHSKSKAEPAIQCTGCKLKSVTIHYTRRRQPLCSACWNTSTTCSAPYCKTVLHKNQDGIVASKAGKKFYCSDCALVKTVPEDASKEFHPLSWDYMPECWCRTCLHLAGKSPKWPKVYRPTPDTVCDCCNDQIHSAASLAIEGTSQIYCHTCAKDLKTCPHCEHPRPKSQYHSTGYAHSNKLCVSCDPCMKEHTSKWLCTASCKCWYPNLEQCDCGGVLPYNYTPKTLTFLKARSQRRANIEKVPFLGLELEVEAQHGRSSRIAGAKIVNTLAGDYGYVVHDGTLLGTNDGGLGGQKAFELVTFPFTYEWFDEQWPNIENLLATLSAKGYRSWEGGRCGIHVHISRAPMSDAHQMKFIRFIYGSVNMMLCIGQRGYRDKSMDKNAPFHKEDRANFIAKIRDYINPNVHGHYAALNTDKEATLEGRWFRGTLNPHGVRKNVEFMHSLWYFTKMYGFASANEINYIEWLRESPQSKQYSVILDFLEREYVTRR